LKAIVLCGGRGTRLGNLTTTTPKPILIVAGRPFLYYVLDQILLAPIDEIILAVGFEWQKIRELIGDSWNGVPISYSIEREALGTGGAIKLAMHGANLQEALVFNGDTLLKINPDELRIFSESVSADVGVGLSVVAEGSRFGSVSVNDLGRIMDFNEKTVKGLSIINAGVYCIRNSVLDYVNSEKFSFENDFLIPFHRELLIYGMSTDTYFIDMGIPQDFERAQIELKGLIGERDV
jgi:D-glycero-alpha-D-manno-heptose 1-phosphate guanylyltransferase